MSKNTKKTLPTITIPRTGNRPLRFRGELIGEGSCDTGNWNHWEEVRIYITTGGKYVVEIERSNPWNGRTQLAKLCETTGDLLAFLEPEEKYLSYSAAAVEAIEEAGKSRDEVWERWVEDVDRVEEVAS